MFIFNNMNSAGFQYLIRTTIYIAKMPYAALIKNLAADQQAGNANGFWKYPLGAAVLCYPVPFYYHENPRVNERRHLLALGIKTQYEKDLAAGKYPVEDN